MERLTEKKDYEKDKSLLDLEKEYQQKLLKANEEYNVGLKKCTRKSIRFGLNMRVRSQLNQDDSDKDKK